MRPRLEFDSFRYAKPTSPQASENSIPTNDATTPLAEGIGNQRSTRRGFLVAAALTGLLATSDVVDIQALFKGAELRVDFNDIWDEVQAFLNPPTDDELQEMAYNPNAEIPLTSEKLQNLLLVADGDSMNLAFGVRKNSQGPEQPNSWVAHAADNFKKAAILLGIPDAIQAANYAQPGAAKGLVDYQPPAGNVQLGATDRKDMDADHRGEIPPRQLMENHDGTVIATIGMNGDHLREAMDKMLGYMNSDVAFKSFCSNPSLEKIDNHIKFVLKDILGTYKKNIQQFTQDFEQALAIYDQINHQRVTQGKSQLILVSTLPINYRYAKNVPYQPLADDQQRKSGGYVSLDTFPKARSAALRLTSSFYQTINPALEAFHERTGLQVITIPMLDLSKTPELFAEDGHFNDKGEEVLGNMLTKLFSIVDTKGNSLIAFDANGSASKVT